MTITEPRGQPVNISTYFKLPEPALERWAFSYYTDYFAQDARAPTPVNVTSKVWRRVALYKPGTYTVNLSYNNGSSSTVAEWYVRPVEPVRTAKNVILFIGDGMTQNMITAAR